MFVDILGIDFVTVPRYIHFNQHPHQLTQISSIFSILQRILLKCATCHLLSHFDRLVDECVLNVTNNFPSLTIAGYHLCQSPVSDTITQWAEMINKIVITPGLLATDGR